MHLKTVSIYLSLALTASALARADEDFKITPDVVYGHKAGMALTFDVIHPKESNGVGILFMMSGGWISAWVPPDGFISPNAPDGLKHFRELVEHGYTLFIVRHGSSPQFKVPEAVADVRRAVRFIRLHAADYKIDPDRIGVCGGSAGGHLSLMLGTASDDGSKDPKDAVDRVSDRVACVVAYFPPVDLRDWVGDKRFPALDFDPKQAESVSPILFVTKDDPPTLLIHGDKDDLVKIDNSEKIKAALLKEGVPCELIVMHGAGHGFAGEQGKEASEALIKWFDKYLAKAADGADKKRDAGVNDREKAATREQDAAIAEIKRLGGKVTFDDEAAGMPVFGIDFSDTPIGNDALKNVEPLMTLKALILTRTHVTDAGLKHIEGLSQLRRLLLDETQVTDAGLEHIKPLVHLEDLMLNKTQVTDAGLRLIGGLAELKRLGLDDTKISDEGLKQLTGLKALKGLNTDHTQVTIAGQKELRDALPNLRAVYP